MHILWYIGSIRLPITVSCFFVLCIYYFFFSLVIVFLLNIHVHNWSAIPVLMYHIKCLLICICAFCMHYRHIHIFIGFYDYTLQLIILLINSSFSWFFDEPLVCQEFMHSRVSVFWTTQHGKGTVYVPFCWSIGIPSSGSGSDTRRMLKTSP